VAQGAELVALPEYFPIMGLNEGDKVLVREQDGSGPIQDWLAATAARHGIWLIGGSIPLAASVPDKVLNSSVAYGPDGKRVARYDKIHLFGFQKGAERYNESATIEAGHQPVAFTTPFGRVGLSICYDLRFPELYRALGEVDLLVIPAAFHRNHRARPLGNPAARPCHRKPVLRAGRRPGGQARKRPRNARQQHADRPLGQILDRKLKGPGIVIGEVDHAASPIVRASLPALQHRVFK
jgi:predicted amidohydrolase